MKSLPPVNGDGVLGHTPTSGKQGLAQSTSSGARVQACNERRQLELLWLTARTLVHIDGTLTDLQTLAQQQADLLRAILAVKRRGAP